VGFVFKYCVIGNPFTAVGAYLSCPHIRKHPRNGGRIYVFGYARTRARWIRPYALRCVRWVFAWVFVDILWSVLWRFRG